MYDPLGSTRGKSPYLDGTYAGDYAPCWLMSWELGKQGAQCVRELSGIDFHKGG